jgi:hypothetical protein
VNIAKLNAFILGLKIKKTSHKNERFPLSCKMHYASNGIIETNDLFSAFFWNFTTPSTLACNV